MPTIIDVAKKAGVSKSTVSRVLSGQGYASQEATRKVQEAVRELNYVPNFLARNFRKSQTKTIGFIVNGSIKGAASFLEHFITIAESFGYEVILYSCQADKKRELDYLDFLKYKQVDAFFILTRSNDWPTILAYQQYGPLATWHRIDSKQIYSSYIDHYQVYLELGQELLAQKKRVLFVLNRRRTENTKSALRAITALKKHGLVAQNCFETDVAKLIATAQEGFDTVFFYMDKLACEFHYRWQKLKQPQLDIISLDNTTSSHLLDITSVDMDLKTQAQNCFSYLYNQLNQTTLPLQKKRPTLVIRQSWQPIQTKFKFLEVKTAVSY
ncbi:LacI family DNA-binding transcriptional regulator [Ligilactobacillus sp. Marseille-Q7487]|uniref:LacI family DNA-binding transcriptional regulator n=1 Tax=Ligilactobacillus sp. Marseille-Q7487 TaxID=3022128 RepID=UPI0024A82E1D|nr:LacI family DNA-binding transcriptional regulator [Ligilactobacillus sp. Marseille-Q7487]